MIQKLKNIHDSRDAGFSLLELVVAVSIMLILGVVGFVAYQSYTDNARQAALDTSANQVLTAVIAEDNTPNGDVEHVVAQFNQTSDDIMVDVAAATSQHLAVEATTCEGGSSFARAPGNYSHVDTTSFSDVQYEWTGAPHESFSRKIVCGEVVQTNHAENPISLNRNGWVPSNHDHVLRERVTLNDHPMGITSGIKAWKKPGSERNESLALYSIGGTQPEEYGYYTGVWIKSTMPATAIIDHNRADAVEVPANTWTFVVSNQRKEQYTPNIRVSHESSEMASEAVTWATGAIITYDAPPTAYFDGDM